MRFSFLALCSPILGMSWALAAQTVQLTPGMDVPAKVAASPPGTSFLFAPGSYYGEISPKDGDSFQGQGQVILSGARPLTFQKVGRAWSAVIGTVQRGSSKCLTAHPLCDLRTDLYLDDVPLSPVLSPDELTEHTWFYDSAAGAAIIGFDPNGHKLEFASARWAFRNSAANVTISHLIVEKYASPAQFGAIGAQGAAPNGAPGAQNWTVSDTEVRLSHGTGIQLGDHGHITRCHVHHNGQKGVGAKGAGVVLEDSEISFNNYAGYDHAWEAGGTKFARTTGLRVLRNYVHDNDGAGLWADIDNHDALFRQNRVDHNQGAGIQYEISYGALIEQNTVRWNGSAPRVSLWQAQISVQNSSDVVVKGNTVVVGATVGNGIVVINQERGSGDQGRYLGQNNTVVSNTVTFEGSEGASGLMDTLGTAENNHFDRNTYVLKAGGQHFESRGKKSWEQFRALGQDQNSRLQDLTTGSALGR